MEVLELIKELTEKYPNLEIKFAGSFFSQFHGKGLTITFFDRDRIKCVRKFIPDTHLNNIKPSLNEIVIEILKELEYELYLKKEITDGNT